MFFSSILIFSLTIPAQAATVSQPEKETMPIRTSIMLPGANHAKAGKGHVSTVGGALFLPILDDNNWVGGMYGISSHYDFGKHLSISTFVAGFNTDPVVEEETNGTFGTVSIRSNLIQSKVFRFAPYVVGGAILTRQHDEDYRGLFALAGAAMAIQAGPLALDLSVPVYGIGHFVPPGFEEELLEPYSEYLSALPSDIVPDSLPFDLTIQSFWVFIAGEAGLSIRFAKEHVLRAGVLMLTPTLSYRYTNPKFYVDLSVSAFGFVNMGQAQLGYRF